MRTWDPTIVVPFGYVTSRKTLGEINVWLLAHHHPEYVRRLLAWLTSKGGAIGVGGGWRAGGAQPNRPGFAPEGKSFHQNQYYNDGFLGACAVDLVVAVPGQVHRAPRWSEVAAQGSAEAARYGVHCNVSTEPWHMQPVEIDGWQSWWNAGRPAPVPGYPLPDLDPPVTEPLEPAPNPPTHRKGDLMYTVFKKPNGGYCFGRITEWWCHIASAEVKNAAVAGGAIDLASGRVVTSWGDVGVVAEDTFRRVMGQHRGDNV